MLAVDGKPLVCFYSRHDAEEGLRYRISKSPLSLDDWHPEQILTFDEVVQIAAVHLRSGGFHGLGGPVRTGQAEDLVPGVEQFAGDGGTDESGGAGDEYTHGVPSL